VHVSRALGENANPKKKAKDDAEDESDDVADHLPVSTALGEKPKKKNPCAEHGDDDDDRNDEDHLPVYQHDIRGQAITGYRRNKQ
jgi:hypothetical protein